MALRLHAITVHEGPVTNLLPAGIATLPVRELMALVAEAPYTRVAPDPEDAVRVGAILDGVAARRALLPAPYGTVFRGRDALERWMELHYVALCDALAFVEDRAAVRVHVRKQGDVEGDAMALADTIFRGLRRRAVAAVLIGGGDDVVATSAFLVERDLWGAFEDGVQEEARRFPTLDVSLSGPWAPYDFVRLQFVI